MLNLILLQEAAPQAGFDMSIVWMMIAIFVIFYFFMIRPQNKRQKKIREEREKLQKGSKVITSGGIYGRVKEVKENVFVIEIADGVKITVDKSCIYAASDPEAALQDAQVQKEQK